MANKAVKSASAILDDDCDVLVTSTELIPGKLNKYQSLLIHFKISDLSS